MNPATYREEVSRELQSILEYWIFSTPDEKQGGFLGRITAEDQPDPEAPKGLVMNARILWSFSAAWRHTGQWIYRPVATRAYEYLAEHFLDKDHGGAFWSLTAAGEPLQTRKQIYGHAFTLYGFSEYYRATDDPAVLDQAISLYKLIERHSYDPIKKGYFEAFSRDWTPLDDKRLSEKDENEQKTTNTQLHILEAYTNLYHAWPDTTLRERIRELISVFKNHIVDDPTGRLRLFFADDWQPRSSLISYGHEIEAAWLLHAAAVAIDDDNARRESACLALKLAAAAAQGLDNDGGLWYEKEGEHLIREKHWWPQAEAMAGFLYVWTIDHDNSWWQRSVNAWTFVKQYIRDPHGREWFWGIQADHTPMPGQDKAGFWKCPYHNSRACLKIMHVLRMPDL